MTRDLLLMAANETMLRAALDAGDEVLDSQRVEIRIVGTIGLPSRLLSEMGWVYLVVRTRSGGMFRVRA